MLPFRIHNAANLSSVHFGVHSKVLRYGSKTRSENLLRGSCFPKNIKNSLQWEWFSVMHFHVLDKSALSTKENTKKSSFIFRLSVRFERNFHFSWLLSDFKDKHFSRSFHQSLHLGVLKSRQHPSFPPFRDSTGAKWEVNWRKNAIFPPPLHIPNSIRSW